ncbi:hypothetical protein NUU61_003841 [Penicillium alfredii]|uniref:Uncharacterized protein n=1 Tax=Penicillium alfredii TaxID=1506179 RepID=A0A9W9FJZ3_9EURO|nr:uncharacterized protein NUU61_003841 [Penicillium alfredii]KAJ5101619.1 hypothetical protein NUU61_003841 [Penicillium alfredii]
MLASGDLARPLLLANTPLRWRTARPADAESVETTTIPSWTPLSPKALCPTGLPVAECFPTDLMHH